MTSVQSHTVERDLDTIRGLADVLTAPPALMPSRLSTLLAPLIPHSALVFLVADAARQT